MKKYLLAIFMLLITSLAFAEEIPKNFYGTYLPEKYIEALKEHKIHIKALLKNRNTYYDILCITDYNGRDTIFSNLGFHDQFAVDKIEFRHNWKKKNSKIITDKKNNRYIKISDGTGYYHEIRKFISKEIFSIKKYKNKSNVLEILDSGNIVFNNNEYRLNLDYLFRNELYDEFYCIKEMKYILIKQVGEKIIVTEIEKDFPRGEKSIASYEFIK